MPPTETITQDNPAPHTPPTTNGSHNPKHSFSKLSFPKKFSRQQLLIFAAAFGLIGAFFIFRSFAAVPVVATMEAETMTLPATGTSIISDATASAGQAIRMDTNSTATGTVNLPANADSLTIRARGDLCRGNPTMVTKLDGVQIASTSVGSTSWTNYSVTKALAAGSHSISISFTNDYTRKCSRNLYVDKVDFMGATTTTPPPSGSTTTTLTPVADTYVSKNNSSASYGTATSIRVDSGDSVSGDNAFNGYLMFDLSAQASNITSAKLRMYVNNTSTDKQNINAVADTSWTESLTYGSPAPAMGTLIAATPGNNTAGWLEIDVTSYAASKAGQKLSFGLDQTGTDGFGLDSRESVNKPQLIVTTDSTTTTPVPTVSFSASPTTVASGATSTLTWSSTNATACTASGSWTGTKATSGTETTAALTASATYSLSCTGAGGTGSGSVVVVSSATATCPSFDTFGVGNWPGACWRPFASTAAWNREIPANPRLLTTSAGYTSQQMVDWLKNRGPTDNIFVNTGGSWDYSHPYYFAKDTDALVTLKDTKYIGPNNNVTKIRVPSAALPRSAAAAGDDAHISIIQPDGAVCGAWQYAGTTSGIASASAWGCGNVLSGNGSDNFTTTAAWFSNMAGQIRAQEMEAGVINHALFAVTNCSWSDAVAPARAGTTARKCLSAQAALPMGARIQLDPSYVLPSNLPAWKYPILRALQKYGAIVGDTGAYSRSISFGLQMESGQGYVSSGEADKVGVFAEKVRPQGGIAKGTNGSTTYWSMDWGNDIDMSRLRIVDSCVSLGTCP